MIGGGRPFYWKFWIKLTALERNRRFSISFRWQWLSRNTSEKDQLTLTGSPLRAFQGAQDEHCTLCLSHPKGWIKNAKCPKFEQYAAITPKQHEIGRQLLLITNRKLHTGFRLVPTSMTLNAVIALILRFFTEFDRFSGWLYHSDWR